MILTSTVLTDHPPVWLTAGRTDGRLHSALSIVLSLAKHVSNNRIVLPPSEYQW